MNPRELKTPLHPRGHKSSNILDKFTAQQKITGGVGFIVLMIILSFVFTKDKLDERLCIKNPAQPLIKNVILIDGTDAVSRQTYDAIRSQINDFVNKTPEGQLISVFEVNESSQTNLRPIFSKCKVRQQGNQLNEDVKAVEKLYQEKFVKPLNEAIEKVQFASRNSPIAQSISDINLSEYLQNSPSSKLIIFSDMVEYTDKFSMYNCKTPENMVEEYLQARAGSAGRPQFTKVKIELFLIPRSQLNKGNGGTAINQHISTCRVFFWNWFFGDNEAGGFNYQYLPG